MNEKRTILIVDDDLSILRVFTRVLERNGYAVTTKETGRAALSQIAESCCFDAALIDVRLPDMDGTDILPAFQKASPRTVKIIFTGSPDSVDFKNGECKIMDAFLVKPVKPELLLQILEEKMALKQKNWIKAA